MQLICNPNRYFINITSNSRRSTHLNQIPRLVVKQEWLVSEGGVSRLQPVPPSLQLLQRMQEDFIPLAYSISTELSMVSCVV
jgi:hypothetical protein